MKETIILIIKGFIMGIANIIPGVSGGTLALTLGIYEDFIQALSHFFKKLKENIKFLVPILIGIGLAILSMSRVIDYSYDHFPIPTTMFFMGLVIGGVPLLLRKVKGTKEAKQPSSYIIAAITFTLVLVLALSEQLFNVSFKANLVNMNMTGYVLLFLVGVVAAATMVIPGVSGSLVLMLLGYYYPVLKVIKNLTKFKDLGSNFIIAAVFGLGVVVGIVAISKLIEFLLKKFETKTYFGVLGFIISSIIAIPIAAMNNVSDLKFSILQGIVGIIVLAVGMTIGNKLGDE